MATQLDGIYPTILAPLTEGGQVLVAPLHEQIDRVIRAGAAGIKVLGTVGEGHYLDNAEREVIIAESRRALRRGKSLIVGVTEYSVPKAIRHSRKAKELGADYISLQVPTFYGLEPDDVVEFVRRVVEAVDIPIIYYHYPDKTGLHLPEDKLVEILLLEGVVGTKMTSFQFNQVARVIRKVHRYRPEVAFLSGSSFNLLWTLRHGGAGTIDPVSLFEPEIAVRIHSLYRQAEYSKRSEAEKLMRESDRLQDYLYGYLPMFQEDWNDPDVLRLFFKAAMSFGFGIEIGKRGFVSRLKFMLNNRGMGLPVTVTPPLTQLREKDIQFVLKIEDFLEQCRLTQNQSLESRILGPLLGFGPRPHRLPPSQ